METVMSTVKSLRTCQSPYNSLRFWWRLCVRWVQILSNCNYGIVLWDAIFFFLLAKSKVVREVRELGQNRPMVQFDTTPTQSYAESWPVPGGAKIKGGKKFEGGERRFLRFMPYPDPSLFFCFHHFAPCQWSERLQQASGILTWQKDQVKYFWHRPHEKEFKVPG